MAGPYEESVRSYEHHESRAYNVHFLELNYYETYDLTGQSMFVCSNVISWRTASHFPLPRLQSNDALHKPSKHDNKRQINEEFAKSCPRERERGFLAGKDL